MLRTDCKREKERNKKQTVQEKGKSRENIYKMTERFPGRQKMMAWTRVVVVERVRRGQILDVFQSRAKGFADELDEGEKKERSQGWFQDPQPQKEMWPGNNRE